MEARSTYPSKNKGAGYVPAVPDLGAKIHFSLLNIVVPEAPPGAFCKLLLVVKSAKAFVTICGDPGEVAVLPSHSYTVGFACPPPLVKLLMIKRSPLLCSPMNGLLLSPVPVGCTLFLKNQNPICASPLSEARSPKKYSLPFSSTAPALPISPLSLALPFTQCQLLAGEASASEDPPVHWSSIPLTLKGSCLKPFLVLFTLFKMPGHSEGLPSITGTWARRSLE